MKSKYIFPAMAAGMISLLLGAGIAPRLAADSIEHDEILRYIERGELIALDQLLAQHAARLQGRIIDIELEREHGRFIYEIKLLSPQGELREVYIDASSGGWLGQD